MRGATTLIVALAATGCLGGGGEEGEPGPVPVTGRWRQIFPEGVAPPFEAVERLEFRDDGTYRDLERGVEGTYVVDSGTLTTTLEGFGGIHYRSSAYRRVDDFLLPNAMWPERADDGWVGTWRGDEVETSSQASVETSWTLVLRADMSAELSWMNSLDAGQLAGTWTEVDGGDWLIFNGEFQRVPFATLQGRSIGRMAFEQF